MLAGKADLRGQVSSSSKAGSTVSVLRVVYSPRREISNRRRQQEREERGIEEMSPPHTHTETHVYAHTHSHVQMDNERRPHSWSRQLRWGEQPGSWPVWELIQGITALSWPFVLAENVWS